MKGSHTLPSQHIVRKTGFAFFEHLAHATDRREMGFQRGFQPQVHRVVGFAKVLPPLRMSDDDVGHTQRQQHRCRGFTRESSLRLPVRVLTANRHLRALRRFQRNRQVNVRRANHDLVARVAGNQR